MDCKYICYANIVACRNDIEKHMAQMPALIPKEVEIQRLK